MHTSKLYTEKIIRKVKYVEDVDRYTAAAAPLLHRIRIGFSITLRGNSYLVTSLKVILCLCQNQTNIASDLQTAPSFSFPVLFIGLNGK